MSADHSVCYDIFNYIESGEHLNIIKEILIEDPNIINIKNNFQQSLLYVAAACNRPDVIKLLLSYDHININETDVENGWNALHRSLYSGHFVCASILAKKDKNLLLQLDYDNLTPLQLYQVCRQSQIYANIINHHHYNDNIYYQYLTCGLSKFDQLGYACNSMIQSQPRRIEDFNLQFTKEKIEIVCCNSFMMAIIDHFNESSMHDDNDEEDGGGNDDEIKVRQVIKGWGHGKDGRLGTGANKSYIKPTEIKRLIGLNLIAKTCSISDGVGSCTTKSGGGVVWGTFDLPNFNFSQEPKVLRYGTKKFIFSVACTKRVVFVSDDYSFFSIGERLAEPNILDDSLREIHTFDSLRCEIKQIGMNNNVLIILSTDGDIYQQIKGNRHYQKVLFKNRKFHRKLVKFDLSNQRCVALCQYGQVFVWSPENDAQVQLTMVCEFNRFSSIDVAVSNTFIATINEYGQVVLSGEFCAIKNVENNTPQIIPDIFNAINLKASENTLLITIAYKVSNINMDNKPNTLVEIASQQLMENINPLNCISYTHIAWKLRIVKLYEYCLNFLLHNFTVLGIVNILKLDEDILQSLEQLYHKKYNITTKTKTLITRDWDIDDIVKNESLQDHKLEKSPSHDFCITKIRKRRKKLQKIKLQIENLEKLKQTGAELDKDQQRKLSNKPKILKEIEDLNHLLALNIVNDRKIDEMQIDNLNNINTVNDANNINTVNDANNINTVKDANNINTVNDANNINTVNDVNNINTVNDANDVNKASDRNKINNSSDSNNINNEHNTKISEKINSTERTKANYSTKKQRKIRRQQLKQQNKNKKQYWSPESFIQASPTKTWAKSSVKAEPLSLIMSQIQPNKSPVSYKQNSDYETKVNGNNKTKSWSPMSNGSGQSLKNIMNEEQHKQINNNKPINNKNRINNKKCMDDHANATKVPSPSSFNLQNLISAALPPPKSPWSKSLNSTKKSLSEIQNEEAVQADVNQSPLRKAWGIAKNVRSPSLSDIQSQQLIANFKLEESSQKDMKKTKQKTSVISERKCKNKNKNKNNRRKKKKSKIIERKPQNNIK